MFFITFLFLGFTIGRIGDKFGGHLNLPHHWIWGILIVVLGIHTYNILIPFGLGVFISDFKDFYSLKFWGKDEPKVWKFWNID